MNDSTEDEPIPVSESEPVTEAEAPASDSTGDTRDPYRDLGEAVKKAFRAGTDDARKAAKDAIPKAGDEFTRGIHDIAYGLAYLASFGVAIARELTPGPMTDGFSEGTEAGRRAAEKMMEKRRKPAETATDEPPTEDPIDSGAVPV